jgi:hypothetical protein
MSVLISEAAVRSDDDGHAFPTRLLPALALVAFLQLLFAGSRIADWDLTSTFVAMSQGQDPGLKPGKQFLLEGLLPNSVGMGYASLGLRGAALLLATWLTGMLAFLAALAVYCWRDPVRRGWLLLLVAFTHMVDTLSLWQGRTDAYVLACIVVGVLSTSGLLRAAAFALACFCHPPIALIAFAGVAVLRWHKGERLDRAALLVVPLAFILTQILIAVWFPGIRNRAGFMAHDLAAIIGSGIDYAPIVIGSCFVLPILGLFVASPDRVAPLFRSRRAFAFLGWLGFVALLSTLLVLDRTRVATMLTFGPFLLLYATAMPVRLTPNRNTTLIVYGLVALRLLSPHVDMDGVIQFEWLAYLRFFHLL